MFFANQGGQQKLTVRVEYVLDAWEVAEAIDEAIRRGMIPKHPFENHQVLIDGIRLLYRATNGQKDWSGAKPATVERARRMLAAINDPSGGR